MNIDAENVLVTGAAGMIGSSVVKKMLGAGIKVTGIDRKESGIVHNNYRHFCIDLSDIQSVYDCMKSEGITRAIHLAALAHTAGEKDLSYEKYYSVNVKCAENVFASAAKLDVPVLFISTVDVYGFSENPVNVHTKLKPVTHYGRTKAIAEERLTEICSEYGSKYNIYRFSPVYTENIKRDIEKRYYLKAPIVAYIIGKGSEYEVLNIDTATDELINWVSSSPNNSIRIIKDRTLLNTAEKIKEEKMQGRAKFVLHLPRRLVRMGYSAALLMFGKNKYTYLLNKAVYPLRSE